VVREESEWKIGETYGEGWIVIVADEVRCVVRRAIATVALVLTYPSVGKWAWWECVIEWEAGETVVEQEAVTKMGVWTPGSGMGHDRMEIVRLQEVMACVAAEDMDHAG
jgi:hypothetical protein